MEERSVHDNTVVGYTVSCKKREVVLHTECNAHGKEEKTDIVFRGVEAYQIIGDNMCSVLFSVEEVAIDDILDDFYDEFERGIKYMWPGTWNESEAARREHLRREGCKGWLICPSYGMKGFVIAKSMELAVQKN